MIKRNELWWRIFWNLKTTAWAVRSQMFPLQDLCSIAWYFSAIRNTKWVGGTGRHSKTESFVQLLRIAEPALFSCSLDLLPGSATPVLPPTPPCAARDYLGKQKPCKRLNSRLSGSFPGCYFKFSHYPLSLSLTQIPGCPITQHKCTRSRAGGEPGICHQNGLGTEKGAGFHSLAWQKNTKNP